MNKQIQVDCAWYHSVYLQETLMLVQAKISGHLVSYIN